MKGVGLSAPHSVHSGPLSEADLVRGNMGPP